MDINTVASQQLNVSIVDKDQQKAAFFSSFRENGLNVSVDVFDAEWCAGHKAGFAAAFDSFMSQTMQGAKECGLPVCAQK